ncbi:hypothetical protein SAMN05444344_1189 [Tenacibaculum mesophilum]|uniref:Uncharacterized protein n=1 Tax=Tenacibaculum mesophilum TaxID=104268 RepID=A0ABN5T6T6_9FLAO|nr:hypothetical protein [Tenacibaculum mesophilum]AZJ33042.1 hypothetical protein D6200_10935 [Tenacibaculum mesophilum]QFS28293.1 hypothetical protein F9Y86_07760 [Tenacibaculum mesophilum]SHF68631.1 hypothetical protein SAMN05444344_1189 [Tenacibaculum mesophilum]
MGIVKRISVREIDDLDKGVDLKEAFKLVENFELKEELINKFDIDLNENPFLKIKGAKTLVNALLRLEKKVYKFDVDTEISSIHIGKYYDKKSIEIELLNLADEDLLKRYQVDRLTSKSFYTVRTDLLDGLYKADKFLTHLKSIEFEELIESTIDKLEELNKNNSKKIKLRFLEDEEGELFTRAITSTSVYKDYNNNFSVFMALFQLNALNKLGYSFEVEQFSFDDSEIYVLFRQTNSTQKIEKDVTLTFALELTNSEIKSKAVKLNGNFIINTKRGAVYTKNNVKTSVLSIRHGYTIRKAKDYINSLPDNISQYIADSIDNYKNINKLKKFEDIQSFLSKKIDKSNNEEIKKYKTKLKNTLKGRVNSLVDLLEKMDKLESIIAHEDIKAIDFLREKIYDSLIKRGKN